MFSAYLERVSCSSNQDEFVVIETPPTEMILQVGKRSVGGGVGALGVRYGEQVGCDSASIPYPLGQSRLISFFISQVNILGNQTAQSLLTAKYIWKMYSVKSTFIPSMSFFGPQILLHGLIVFMGYGCSRLDSCEVFFEHFLSRQNSTAHFLTEQCEWRQLSHSWIMLVWSTGDPRTIPSVSNVFLINVFSTPIQSIKTICWLRHKIK